MSKIQYNIYHMLSYAYKILKKEGKKSLDCERFENAADLLSAILVKGVTLEIKKGLGKEYISFSEPLSTLKGKIDITRSVKEQTHLKRKIYCHYDEFSVNSKLNQVLKATMLLLLQSKSSLSKSRKQELKKLLRYFNDVDTISIDKLQWGFRFHKNNLNYQMLIGICHLIVRGLLQKEDKGKIKINNFLDDQSMGRLFEKFVLEYYKKHAHEYEQEGIRIEVEKSQKQIPWGINGEDSDTDLPKMQADIMIFKKDSPDCLIIDTKFYTNIMLNRYFDNGENISETKKKLRSSHLYQIFTYTKNEQLEKKGNVSGMLLYAKTDEEKIPKAKYNMSGNNIFIDALDLNKDFENIKQQLFDIITRWYDA